jgi:hypothetical protein
MLVIVLAFFLFGVPLMALITILVERRKSRRGTEERDER